MVASRFSNRHFGIEILVKNKIILNPGNFIFDIYLFITQ